MELVGGDLHGITVHEAARVMSAAASDEVLVSEPVVALCRGTDLVFEDAGEYELKGVPGRLRLYRVTS